MRSQPAIAEARLRAVISEAWAVFGRCRFEAPIEVCRCSSCVGPETYSALLKTPIAEMPLQLIAEYTNSAHGAGGRIDEQLRALLPRYFELVAEGHWPGIDPVVTLRRMVVAGWREKWPANEVAVIDAYFVALFEFWLSHRDGVGRSGGGDVLGFVAYSAGSLETLLAMWDATADMMASLKLAELVIATAWSKRIRRLSPFWDPIEEKEMMVVSWLMRPDTRARLTQGFFMTADPDEQRKFSDAEQAL